MRDLVIWKQFDAEHGWPAETRASGGVVTTTLVGPAWAPRAPFTAAVPSWRASTPPGAWVEIELRARHGQRWTKFYCMAQWDDRREGSRRQSFDAQHDADGRAATDTLLLAHPADAIQPRVLLHGAGGQPPELSSLYVALSGPGAGAADGALAPRELAVPPRAQLDYPNGPEICSPTSLAMLLAYWHAQTGDRRLEPFSERRAVSEMIAPMVYDPVYGGYGNWSFNAAFAASLGLEAYVARFATLGELEPWLAAGVPLAISAAWKAGALGRAPIAASNGHLLVVCGGDACGNVIVADPRGEGEAEVRRTYDAGQLAAAWQGNSSGTAYVIYPRGWPAPAAAVA